MEFESFAAFVDLQIGWVSSGSCARAQAGREQNACATRHERIEDLCFRGQTYGRPIVEKRATARIGARRRRRRRGGRGGDDGWYDRQ